MNLMNIFKKKPDLLFETNEIANLETRFTPDLVELQANHAWNVFVYNECQGDQPGYDEWERPKLYRGTAYTKDSNFTMYKKLLGKGTFPMAFEIGEDQKVGLSSYIGEPGQVMGQVFSVRWTSIVSLDKYLLNTVHFNRKRTKVLLPYRYGTSDKFEYKEAEVWMYVGNQEFWMPQIFHPDSKRLFMASDRLINTNNRETEELLGAYFLFDHKVEAHAP